MSGKTGREGNRGWSERAAGLGRAGSLWVGVALVLALVAMVNFLGWKYHARFDWTATRLYSLSEKTENVLAGLDRDVEVVVFLMPGDALYDPVHELLTRYEAASPRIRLEFMDAARNPLEAQQLAERYGVETASVVFVAGDDRQVVQRDELAELDLSGLQLGREPEVKAFKGERAFTSALVDLAEQVRPKVLFTTGHGELSLDEMAGSGLSELERLLRDDNFEIDEWASMGAAAVPEGTDLVVVAGPRSSFVAPELEALSAYLDRGGRLLVLLDPVLATGRPEIVDVGLEGWLAGWGVEAGRNVVVDPSAALPFFGAETLFVSDFGAHPATRSVREGSLAVLVSLARSVGAGAAPEGFEATELMKTGADGWGETDLADPRRDDADLAGPVPLAVAVAAVADRDAGGLDEDDLPDADGADEMSAGGGEAATGGDQAAAADAADAGAATARLVVIGDSDLATDQLLKANVANGVFLTDAVNWLVERESLLGIPAKEPERVRLSLSGDALRWIYALVLLILPALAVVAGVAVHYRRRRR